MQRSLNDLCWRREGYLEKTLHSLASLRGLDHFTVYVSQDGAHPGVSQLIQGTGRELMAQASVRAFQHWQHPREPALGPKQVLILYDCSLLGASVPS